MRQRESSFANEPQARVANGGAMPDRQADANDGLIAHAHPLRLVKAFAAIDDPDVQRALITLAEEIARAGQQGRGKRV